MTGRTGAALAALLCLILPTTPARAADEDVAGHGKHVMRTIVLDNEDVRPADTSMARGEVLVFENHSVQPLVVAFNDPKDLRDRIRCGLLAPSTEQQRDAPWLLFRWDDGTLTATIPPGRFASVCSLAPGSYGFNVSRRGFDAGGTGGILPEKGTVTVR